MRLLIFLIVFFTLTPLPLPLPVHADTPTPATTSTQTQGKPILYRSDASVDVAVGTPPSPPSTSAQCNFNIQNISPKKYETCNNFYTASNPLGNFALTSPEGNFGDPSCDFAQNFAQGKSNLYNLLKQLDPGYADIWFNLIAPESSYDPNAFNGNSTNGSGAYGLVQMSLAGSTNGQYDRGDVYWQLQIFNGIQYNNTVLNLDSTDGQYCGGLDIKQRGSDNPYCPTSQPTTWCYWPFYETGGLPGKGGNICTKKTVLCQYR